MILKKNFYILTGGPGSGKTTCIDRLRELGFTCVAEAGRKIIKEQLACGGTALPWKDAAAYSELMLQYAIREYTAHADKTEICFFDRGIPDVSGYAALINLPGQEIFTEAANRFRYNIQVFILPPWKEIYTTDSERKQDFTTATDTYIKMKKTYTAYGYQITEVPCLPVTDRIDFIWKKIGRPVI